MYLRFCECLSYEDIARKLNLTISSVKGQLFRARNHIRGELKDYLGIEIVRHPAKSKDEHDTIHITQKHLINKIIQAAKLDQECVNAPPTPSSGLLLKHSSTPEVSPKDAPFNYRSVLGQLNYLAGTTRPDIAFSVNQCARYCNNPRLAHYTAIKRIVRYLVGTKDKGLILPTKVDPTLECYADADFAGNWDKTDPADAENVKSRSGYVLKFAGCPIHWASKLQDLIALSAAHAVRPPLAPRIEVLRD